MTCVLQENFKAIGGLVVKNLPANAGGWVSTPWVGKIPWRRKWQHAPGFFLGHPMDRKAWQTTTQSMALQCVGCN